MPKVKGKIEKVEEITSGITKGKPWTLLRVIIDGKKYTTFDKKYQLLVGQEGEWEYEIQEKDGFQNRQLKRLPKEKKVVPTVEEMTFKMLKGLAFLRGDIKRVEEKVDRLLQIWEKIENSDKVVLYPKDKEPL